MTDKVKSTKEMTTPVIKPYIENGFIVIPMLNGELKKISPDHLEDLFEWDIPEILNGITRSFADLGILILSHQKFTIEELLVDFEAIMPDKNAMFLLSKISDAFSTDKH